MLINFLISLNVHSLYFINKYWGNTALSADGKQSTSLSFLLIIHASIAIFLSESAGLSWRMMLGILIAFHIIIAIAFNKHIVDAVEHYETNGFNKYYFVFITYMVIGLLTLVYLSF